MRLWKAIKLSSTQELYKVYSLQLCYCLPFGFKWHFCITTIVKILLLGNPRRLPGPIHFQHSFTTFASFSSLLENYVLYVIFEIMDIASLVLPVYLVYKSIRSKSTMANGLIIISSAVTFMIMVAYGVYTLLDIIRGAETFNIYSIIFIFIMLIKVTLCIVSLLRIRAINNAVE